MLLCIVRCGSVRFPDILNLTVRAVRCCDKSYGAVWYSSPLNCFCYGSGEIPVRETVKNRSSLVHRMKKP